MMDTSNITEIAILVFFILLFLAIVSIAVIRKKFLRMIDDFYKQFSKETDDILNSSNDLIASGDNDKDLQKEEIRYIIGYDGDDTSKIYYRDKYDQKREIIPKLFSKGGVHTKEDLRKKIEAKRNKSETKSETKLNTNKVSIGSDRNKSIDTMIRKQIDKYNTDLKTKMNASFDPECDDIYLYPGGSVKELYDIIIKDLVKIFPDEELISHLDAMELYISCIGLIRIGNSL